MPHDHPNLSNETKTLWVVAITFVTMIAEIISGLLTQSMALLADGIHMGSHVLAIGLSWAAYFWIRKLKKSKKYSGNPENIIALSGYTSGLLLLMFAFSIIVGAVQRISVPVTISYREAILVAIAGLAVNIVSALLLHHKHEHSDHAIRAAYIHVLADAVTSISAIIGLVAAMYLNTSIIDPIMAIVSSMVIIRWSLGLIKNSGKEIIGFHKNQ